MNVDNFKKVLDHILEEYPDLVNFKPKIEKKFVASDGREYNTYLLSTTYPNFSKLVAKGVVNTSIDLNKERIFTKILADNKVNVPKLFYVNKVPSKYLLLEYIEGEGLEDILLRDTSQSAQIFEKLGSLIGKMHTTKVDGFGDFLEGKSSSWYEYVNEKFTERLGFSKKKNYINIVNYATNLWNDVQELIKLEGKNNPIVNHRDLYLDNFILKPNGDLYVLDFGLLRGGRPFFDLGKFYLLILIKFPQYSSYFVKGYKRFIKLDKDSSILLKFYIVLEILGMMPFFNSIGNEKMLGKVLEDFDGLSSNKGVLNDLIINFK
jgi:tRNA A-37 threonylcarbamoyl transferase component Bud32